MIFTQFHTRLHKMVLNLIVIIANKFIKRSIQNTITHDTQLKFYKVIATGSFLYGLETWIPKNKYFNKIQATEIKIFGTLLGYRRQDKFRNEDNRAKFNIYNTLDKIDKNKMN